MKHLGLLLLLLLSIPAHAQLIVSVKGFGEIKEEAMTITITEAKEDPLTGQKRMDLTGDLFCSVPLSVTITRSEKGLADEFCCAGECIAGNQETTETLEFTPNGMASWFIHYTPAPGSDVEVEYLFSDGENERRLKVHYIYSTQALDETQAQPKARKIIRDGLMQIQYEDKTYYL